MNGKRYVIRRSDVDRRKFEYSIVFPERRSKKADRRIFDRRNLKFKKE